MRLKYGYLLKVLYLICDVLFTERWIEFYQDKHNTSLPYRVTVSRDCYITTSLEVDVRIVRDRMVASAVNFAIGFFGYPFEGQYQESITIESNGVSYFDIPTKNDLLKILLQV